LNDAATSLVAKEAKVRRPRNLRSMKVGGWSERLREEEEEVICLLNCDEISEFQSA